MQKGAATLFLLIAVLLIIGVSGILVFRSTEPSKSQLPLDIVVTPAFQQPTYRNLKLGLEFQYPGKDYLVKEDSEEEFNKRGNGNFRKNFKGYVGYEPPIFLAAVAVLGKDDTFEDNPVTVWVFNNDNNLTIEKWFGDYWYYPFVWGVFDYSSKGHITPDQEATISGQPAKYKIVAYQPGKPKFILVSNSQKMYLIRIINETNSIGDQILSTFKFLQ